ncbi:MAG: mannose-1-phosphate guanylyltransferase/mannose-6-phosphate isomerase [unclassified Hahellaceae]|nr:mannose-1-phosphate guanylyltransferase/mannose-6-phosphate isomerase [Hahellaceae bacterium]|tara:strand:- start:35221 stop:36735 length:1515 start_codon:yes stop_codon:yes gene_type:complete
MIPVILSGGNGSRLWPLSRQGYPKQFLPLVGEQSMFQQTIQRLPAGLSSPIIVTNEAHRFLVQEQLQAIDCDPLQIILEPFGRNTAPAVAMAALEVLSSGRDDIIAVLPADHFIGNIPEYHRALATARDRAAQGDLVLFGITPTAPETGYGYIRTGSSVGDQAKEVLEFVEKPDLQTAMSYLASGEYFWNSGMFVFSARRYIEELAVHYPRMFVSCELAYEASQSSDGCRLLAPEQFRDCPDESIDYALMEKTDAATAVAMNAGWSDLGCWSSLWDTEARDSDDNVLLGDVVSHRSTACYVRSDHRLVATVGVQDLFIVDTKDAVLVAHRDSVQEVKTIVDKLKAARRSEHVVHREVFRPWGSYQTTDLGSRFQVKNIKVKPGASLSLQKHHHRAEHWIVVSGTAEVTRGDEVFLLGENESTYIPVGEVHRLTNPGIIPLEIVEVQSGSYLGEDDIIRLDDIYGRVPPEPTTASAEPSLKAAEQPVVAVPKKQPVPAVALAAQR